PSNSNTSPIHGNSSFQDASQSPDMLENENIVYSDHENVGVEADFNNLETSITASPILTTRIHNAHPISQIIARIEAIRLFLAYASFIGFMVYQMDVKSTFLYGTIEEEVYVCQPPGFEDPDHPDKVYKVVKALYGLHQAPRAWYETLATYFLENGFHRGDKSNTLHQEAERRYTACADLCGWYHIWCNKQRLVKQKKDRIFINQDNYVAEILKKFRLTEGKSASTLIDTEKPLLKDPDGEDVDVHIYRSKISFLMYLTSSRPDIMFADPPFDLVAYSDSDYAGASIDRKSTAGGCQFFRSRLISWQCKKQTVVATSST
nr:hypothetical protein [Tanacetum cinerariifolium]